MSLSCATRFRGIRGFLTALIASAFLVALLPGGSRAASIFMRNGYIIQGPIVERSEDSVVLGWPNGKVTLARRFIESVSFDPGEEKRLVQEEKARKEAAALAVANPMALVAATDELELPSTLEELMRNYNVPGTSPAAALGGSSPLAVPLPPDNAAGEVPGAQGETPGAGAVPPGPEGGSSTVVVMPRPDQKLKDRVRDPRTGVSLKVPVGWDANPTSSAFVITGPSEPDGFRPSLNAVLLSKGDDFSMQDYVNLLKQQNEQTLQGYELVDEGFRDIGKGKAYQLLGRGSYKGNTAYVRQIVTFKGDYLWLVSSFTQDNDSSSGPFAVTEEAVGTLEFKAP